MKLLLRWFGSRQIRHGVDACRQIGKWARAQQDLLPKEALARLHDTIAATREVLRSGTRAEVEKALQQLEVAAQKYLRPYPHARWRENIEVFLVTSAIVLALRTFFFQPMAIPSGSAQPTLFGITQSPDEYAVREGRRIDSDLVVPGFLRRQIDKWWSGISYIHVVAKRDGVLTRVDAPRMFLPFVKRQTFVIGGESYTVRYSSSFESLAERAGLRPGMSFRAGQDVIRMRLTSGDHLFVNRVIYNFRPPKRGEIIVFETHDIRRFLRPDASTGIIPDTHYIKRLVALEGERVRIGDDRHLVIDGRRLDASTPGFENVYTFDPNEPPRRNHYSGHVNGTIAAECGHIGLAPLFPTEGSEFVVRRGYMLPLGDNTMNSADGRAWGDVPKDKLVGRASFVFWPITDRFGWGYR